MSTFEMSNFQRLEYLIGSRNGFALRDLVDGARRLNNGNQYQHDDAPDDAVQADACQTGIPVLVRRTFEGIARAGNWKTSSMIKFGLGNSS